jgi:magnesium transporter
MRNNSKSLRKIRNIKKKKSLQKIGEPPGTLKYTGELKKRKTKISVIDYNKDDYQIQELTNISFDLSDIENDNIRWILVDGLENVSLIDQIGKQFNLHPLILEDILHPNQIPKFEDYKEKIFIVLKKLKIKNDDYEAIDTEQISLILGSNYVLTFREQKSDIFDPILERIKIPKGKIRDMKSDYLLYALVDIIIDNYFIVEESLGDFIEEIEEKLVEDPQIETLQSIYKLRKIVIDFKKSVWPMREVVNKLQREESDLIGNEMQIFLRDIYDHIFRINDSLQNYRDIVSGMLEMYLSSVSNKMNDIMKVLTIISTIFIPLSFLAGLYGMNFAFMPELKSPLGYPLVLGIMFFIGIGMLIFFKHKDWI